ncbi:hypothetical protein Tco_0102183 [Tanacetum coccineum]
MVLTISSNPNGIRSTPIIPDSLLKVMKSSVFSKLRFGNGKKIDEGSASPSDTENRINLLYELEITDNMDQDYLERLATHEEIKEAVRDCGSSKAPGPDEFSFAFLTPPTLITDFHPILLIGIHYKIIAKILANRLSKVIDKIISKEQSAFIVGR